jgi:predicted RNA binding protein YcfA (HicA-like mRNA interferase family)
VVKRDKLLAKLENGSIDAGELRTLLKQSGWYLAHQKGSHEVWANRSERFVLATHSKDLKPYQIKDAKERLLK